MIAPAEVQRTSAALGVSPDVVEHDYALGCFLHFLGELPDVTRSWVFKGGTSLAKCHFTQYRFSEDLDFTLTANIRPDALGELLDMAKATTQAATGLRMDLRPTAVELVDDDYGKESFEAKAYYEGVWRPRGSPRAIRIHANRDEALLFPVLALKVNHPYSDATELPKTSVQAYSLEEIATEKLRALSGQRKYAVARDLYDLWSLNKAGIKWDQVFAAFAEKCRTKGLNPKSLAIDRLLAGREEYEVNWRNNLEYLVPANLKCSFEEAWKISHSLLAKVLG